MNLYVLDRDDILKRIAAYETAYKRVLSFISADSDKENIIRIQSPLCDSAKYYKQKINQLKEQLKGFK